MSGLRIADAIDLHCHFGPDTFCENHDALAEPIEHSVTGLQAAREAHASGYRALVLKSHSFASPAVAHAVQEAVPGLRVFGGVCTDLPSGGLNPKAVEAALRLGARIVWLPTVHSHQDYLNGNGHRFGIEGEGLRVVGDDGRPTATLEDIVALVRQFDAVLATGHVTAAEHYAVVKAFARTGPVLVTHAGEALSGPHLTPSQCVELADLGGIIELTALACDSVWGCPAKSPREVGEMIAAIGHERCTLSSDYGWSTMVPRPAPGLRNFLESLWRDGVSERELTTMVATTPARLLRL